MAILTKDEIIKKVESKDLIIEPFIIDNLDAGSLDVSLGNTFRIFKKKFPSKIRVTENIDFDEVSETIVLSDDEEFVLEPWQLVHANTKEKITLSGNLCGWIEGRSRFARIGLIVHITAPFIQPGSSGNQILEMINSGPIPLVLKPGVKIAQLIFEECKGNAVYKGRFQNQDNP